MTGDPGLTSASAEQWLSLFVERLQGTFGDRLVFVGCQGSWAREEGRPDSDIDAVVVLDKIESRDLAAYREIVASMPDGGTSACGIFLSVSEVREHEPHCEMAHLYYGCKTLHGTLDGILRPPTQPELIQEIRFRMGNAIHAARHYLLFPHDLRAKVHNLRSEYKYVPLHLRWWLLLSTGTYHKATADLARALEHPDDKDMLRMATDWEKLSDDHSRRPLYYIEFLESWGREMLARVAEYEQEHGLGV